MKPSVTGGFGIIRKAAILKTNSLMLEVEFINSEEPVTVFYNAGVLRQARVSIHNLVNTVRFVEYEAHIAGVTTYLDKHSGEEVVHTSDANTGTFTRVLERGTEDDPVAARLLMKLEIERAKADIALSSYDEKLEKQIEELRPMAHLPRVAALIARLEAQKQGGFVPAVPAPFQGAVSQKATPVRPQSALNEEEIDELL